MNILVVEDDADVSMTLRMLIESLFPRQHFEWVCAYDVTGGMTEALRRTFDGLILDLKLPGSDSPEDTIDQFADVIRKVPTVVVTGYDDAHLGIMCIEHGAVGYALKADIPRMTSAFSDLIKRAKELSPGG